MTLGARVRAPSLAALGLLGVVALGVIVGLGQLDDNSFLTHLATGRLILDEGSVPSSDPYSWSEPGTPWVVQSWLPSLLYAAAERAGGALALRLLFGAQFVLLALIVWRLSRRATSLLPRLAIVGVAVLIGKAAWPERPLVMGLLCLGATLLVVEEERPAWWLVPLGWIWANSHGSFPLGLVLLTVLAVGSRLDGERRPKELRPLALLAAGVVLGAVGPIGPDLLLFPLTLVSNTGVLKNVIEWRAPGFTTLWERLFLVQLGASWLALVKRPSWRSGLVVTATSVLALVAVRNAVIASLVLTPVLAAAWGGHGALKGELRPRLAPVAAALLVALTVIGGAARLDEPHFNLRIYPVEAVEWLDSRRVDFGEQHLVHEDFVGNYLELRFGPDAEVFYDDRFDMWSEQLSEEYFELVVAGPGALDVLDDHEAEVVLWRRTGALSALLALSPSWRIAYADEHFVVACRRSSAGGACAAAL